MTTATSWMHLALFSLCCYHELQPAAFGPSWMSKQFPCDVTHNAIDIKFDCIGRHLKSIPDGITSNATKLYLGKNPIQNISHDAFSNLGNLTLLSLSWVNNHKELRHWDMTAFRNLTNLHELKLTGICLREVPRYLPPNLETLELDNNNILLLNDAQIKRIPNVTKLFMAKNCYYQNPCGQAIIVNGSFLALTKLKVLTLSNNNLTDVPQRLPKSLVVLELGFNRIQYLSEDDFRNLTNLKTLRLQGNCPRCETASHPCKTCHPNTYLDIHPHAFANLRQLETLHLSGNSLQELKASWFESLTNLKVLLLSFNFLIPAIDAEGEARFLSYLPRLEKMDLSFNYMLKVYPKTIELSNQFSKLVSLKTLHLVGLVFKEITQKTLSPLCELKNLSVLNLGTNFIVSSNSTIFSNFKHVKMIYLAENRLYPVSVSNPPVPNNGHNLKSDVSTPFLTRPRQQDHSYELLHRLAKQECFDSGRVLILSSNNIFFITPEQFKGYGEIACLNLSRNGFSAALNGTEFTYLPNLTYLDLSYNKIDLAYDNAFGELIKLEVLDLSYNPHYFESYGVTHNLNFLKNLPALRVLNMSSNSISVLTTKEMNSKSLSELQFQHNNLGILWKRSDKSYNKIFLNLTNLTILDISFNYITKILKDVYRNLPRNLTKLVLSHNSLYDFQWKQLRNFAQLQILDLSFNSLSCVPENISKFTQTLRLLDLSNNKIVHLSNEFLKGAESLETLHLDNNKLTIISQSTFPGSENSMKTLFLHHNPFQCTCDMLQFILWMETSNVMIPNLTTDVTCSMPANRRGEAVILFDIHQCVDNKHAFLIYILSSTFILITLLTTTTAHIFYWDASYVLHYLRARLKGYRSLSSSDSVYGAFVTYDTKDPQVSEWVMEHLRVQLEEEGEKHLPLCLEERDWPLGVPLVDNLTRSIQCSRKTLFVLTEAYVKTGAFRLAMYLAHQRLLDENVDVIVLLMLEPVLQHSHFLRLRRRLCGKSVVEWPRTAAAEPWFWQNLRNVVRVDNQVMYSKSYSRYFNSR